MANLRIKKKHLNPDAVDGTKLKLLAGESVRVVDAEGDTVDLVKLDENGNVVGNGFELAKKVDLDSEVSSRQAALSAEESARIAGDASEASSRQAADESLQSALDAEESARIADVNAEESRALAAEAALQSAIVAESSSRQAAIADLINSAPAVLDTLKELADALGGDDDFATTIANRFSNIESSLSAATQDGTDYTDLKHQEILDLVSLTLLKKEEVILTEQNITDGYVSLSGAEIIARSMAASIDRLNVFESEDFSLSVVDGVTRMTFLNSFASGGDEAVEAGEKLRLTYWSLD
jgi:multidrug efflux pump subunit AcrA (membrane-fusion protein)